MVPGAHFSGDGTALLDQKPCLGTDAAGFVDRTPDSGVVVGHRDTSQSPSVTRTARGADTASLMCPGGRPERVPRLTTYAFPAGCPRHSSTPPPFPYRHLTAPRIDGRDRLYALSAAATWGTRETDPQCRAVEMTRTGSSGETSRARSTTRQLATLGPLAAGAGWVRWVWRLDSLSASSPGLSSGRRLRRLYFDPAGDVVAHPVPVHQDGRVRGGQRFPARFTDLAAPVHRFPPCPSVSPGGKSHRVGLSGRCHPSVKVADRLRLVRRTHSRAPAALLVDPDTGEKSSDDP